MTTDTPTVLYPDETPEQRAQREGRERMKRLLAAAFGPLLAEQERAEAEATNHGPAAEGRTEEA